MIDVYNHGHWVERASQIEYMLNKLTSKKKLLSITTDLGQHFRFYKLGLIQSRIEEQNQMVHLLPPHVREQTLAHVQMLQTYKKQEWQENIPRHLTIQLLQVEEVWKATLAFTRYAPPKTKEVDPPAYTVMAPQSDIPERSVHISDEQLERVVEKLMTKLRTTTTVTKIEHNLGYSIDNQPDLSPSCTSIPLEFAPHQAPNRPDFEEPYDVIEKELRCYLCGQTGHTMTNSPRRRNPLLDSPQGDIPPPHDNPRQAKMTPPSMALSIMGPQNTKPPVIPCNARLTTNWHIPTADNSQSILIIGGKTPSLPIFDSSAENAAISTKFAKQLGLTP